MSSPPDTGTSAHAPGDPKGVAPVAETINAVTSATCTGTAVPGAAGPAPARVDAVRSPDARTQLRLCWTPIDVTAYCDQVTLDCTGATSLFVGTTRDNFAGRRVTRLEYEAYDGMALREMAAIVDAARSRCVSWCRGVVVSWCCGVVVLWCCGVVELWSCGVVELWCCGVVNVRGPSFWWFRVCLVVFVR